MLPLQQPLGHDAASHTHAPAALHAWPVVHAPQLAPPVPHEPFDCEPYASHTPPDVQHPMGHELASHWQTPVVMLHS